MSACSADLSEASEAKIVVGNEVEGRSCATGLEGVRKARPGERVGVPGAGA